MTDAETGRPADREPLRLWPGVVIVLLQWLGWSAVPRVAPDAMMYGVLGAVAAGPLLGLWWLFFSRARWSERLGAAVLVVGAMAATYPLLHESVAQGNMGFQFVGQCIPVLSLAFVAWAVATRNLSAGVRGATMVVVVVVACGSFTLLRSRGLSGEGFPDFTWRWTPTAEEELLARTGDAPLEIHPPPPEAPGTAAGANAEAGDAEAVDLHAAEATSPAGAEAAAGPAPDESLRVPAWPGFRGPGRDGVLPGLRIGVDWSASPPVELWRRPVGPGVSSFAVSGGLFYTQEQRGDHEVVTGYDLATGEPVWRHADENRFWDSHVGAGPRATPAVSGGRVYALGANGLLNALDAADGRVLWSRNAADDAAPGAEVPLWGYTSSPLVVGERVIVHARGLVAYDAATGEPCWFGPRGGSYGSPQLLTIEGVPQLVTVTHAGVVGVAPADGGVLWEHAWPGVGVTQPVLAADGGLLISTIDDGAVPVGTRRLAVARGAGGWTVEERWTSLGLKPSFSPIVAHEGHAYGFDGRFVACIDVAEGERQWKGGRYGSGQLLLLPEQDLLLVVSEQGDLVLVKAAPDAFAEIARFPGIDGRTWNQPALAGDVLLVRNGEEMAAFRLPPAASARSEHAEVVE